MLRDEEKEVNFILMHVKNKNLTQRNTSFQVISASTRCIPGLVLLKVIDLHEKLYRTELAAAQERHHQ